MTKKGRKNRIKDQSGVYQIGLNRKSEAVISAHFMHDINQQSNLHLYSLQEFSKNALTVDVSLIFERLIPTLIDASDKFIKERVSAVKIRAKKNFTLYGLNSPNNIDVPEMITEIMFDRQFIKGPRSNTSRLMLYEKIKKLIEDKKPIKMVILALPYKSSSPLKCRGDMPDLAEVNFLLELVEVAKTIDFIYRNDIKNSNNTMGAFTVICDGSRFNTFLNEHNEKIEQYQEHLRWWIKKLGISNYVEIFDYQNVIANYLSQDLQLEKKAIRERVFHHYTNLMVPLLDPYHMSQTMNKAIAVDPDPEMCNPEGRYIPLFKSLIYIVKYTALSTYADLHAKNYVDLYQELTRHIFEPYIELSKSDLVQVENFISNPLLKSPTPEKLLEYLRQSMLREAWHAAIHYMAEIRSDRDLSKEPIITCFPDHIRWTIHAKPGQVAILATTAFGFQVQPWHGVGVLKRTKHDKIKLYTLPVLSLESINATPITVENIKNAPFRKDQPLFYVYPDIQFDNIDALFETIEQHMIRKRKW
ncbi:MAG: L-tyrosine/L-tryptophan isonitrile synthase family protein [Gammaproteobacteria bacterium]|jgi:hypothetical protein|nr:L-tyrosine/L-tryptophan isonitrile synthase family protein [Gammaproteobacteria bacterium]